MIVDLSLGTATGEGQDVVSGVASVIGSRFDDLIIGTDGNNRLEGEDGDDTVEGLGGDDLLVGGPGNDGLEGGDGSGHEVLDQEDEVPEPGLDLRPRLRWGASPPGEGRLHADEHVLHGPTGSGGTVALAEVSSWPSHLLWPDLR